MAYNKEYSRIVWENEPSTHSPLNENNLNKMDFFIDELDSRTVELSQHVDSLEGYETRVAELEEQARESANTAVQSATQSQASATQAQASEGIAVEKADDASDSAILSESWAIGGTDTRTGEDTNNSKYWQEQAHYWYELAKRIAESFSGALRPMGTVAFEDLPDISDSTPGDMYNISNAFVTTDDFMEGAGHDIPAGSNVYLAVSNKWDILTGSPVSGVKGEAETDFRQGNVNITKDNIGLQSVDIYVDDGILHLPSKILR